MTAPLALRAGPWQLDFEGGDLRRLAVAGTVAVARIYAAVRDDAWRTIPGEIRDLEVDLGADRFRIAYTAGHSGGAVRFRNRIELSGEADGRIAVAMRGEALAAFSRNRIGLCVHHPHTCAGGWVRITHPGGASEELRFPQRIAPHQPFLGVTAIATRPLPGLEAEVRFAGEVFETEDQRNWGDASFKTYGTPLALPRPVAVAAGTRIEQRIDLSLAGRATAAAAPSVRAGAAPAVAADIAPLPHPPAVVAALRACRLDRLRLALAAAPGWEARLAAARHLARELALPIDLVVVGDPQPLLRDLAAALADVRLASLAALPGDRSTTPAAMVAALRGLRPGLALGGGNASQFTELNRDPPAAAGWDLVAFPVDPYVHAVDHASLHENLPALAEIAAAARHLAPGAAVHLALAHDRHGDDPELVRRHAGEAGAAWLAGALRAAAGVDVLGCGPTTGAMGLVAADGTPTPAARFLAGR